MRLEIFFSFIEKIRRILFFKRNHNTRYEDGQPTDVVKKSFTVLFEINSAKLVDEFDL